MPEELHPIVAQLTPNEEQLPAIRARGCDVVVTAGAGTGKTRTLVGRYLSLLAEGKPLRSIVAITFTRKAAREMRNRVRAEIQRYLAEGVVTPKERDRWQRAYAALDAARIGTMHSLCGEILRSHPAEAGVDPRFQVLEEGQAALLRREILDTALAWAADDPEAVGLFAMLDGAGALRQILQTLLQRRLDADVAFGAVPPEPLAHWREILRERQRGQLEALGADPAWTEAWTTLRKITPIDPDDRMAAQRRWVLRLMDDVVSAGSVDRPLPDGGSNDRGSSVLEETQATLSRLDEISLVGGSSRAWRGGNAEKTVVKDALRTLRELWRDHADLLSLQLNAMDEKLANAISGLEAVFRFACQRYRAAKRDRRALDFDDLESGAVEILREHPAVRTRWEEQVEAILVDEFQDTNERQRTLVHLLGHGAGTRPSPEAEPRPASTSTGKLFIVGDAKQSIYGFRGADVTVFRAERERIAGGGGEGWPLATSYRAHQGLVRALNDLLRPVLGERSDPRRPWAEPFAPIAAYREASGPGIQAPYVEFHLTVGNKGDGALDRAARALVGRIAKMVDSGAQVANGEALRPLGYGDIAILCRASNSFSHYEDALDEAELPYLTVAGRGFYDRPEIRDLLNALKAVADPSDDLALVGLLRSPAVGLSDAAIYRLVQARAAASASNDVIYPLWDTLCRGQAELGQVSDRRVGRAASLISELHTMAGRAQVGDLLKALLDETHYQAALLKAGQPRAVRNVEKLLRDAHTSGLVQVSAFIEYVSGLQDSGAREGEARAPAGGAVQIMSVHQAKGLEFPIVVLGDATWAGGGPGRDVLVDQALGVLLPLRASEDDELAAVYRLAQARHADQGAAESDRLLYVAATRAREKLLINGYLSGVRKDGTPYKLGGWLGKLGRPLGLHAIEISYDHQGSHVHRWRLHLGGTSADCVIYEPACSYYEPASPPAANDVDTPATRLPPPLLAPVDREETQVGLEREPQRVLRVLPETKHTSAPSRVVGRLVHDALAAWRLPGGREDEDFRQWVRARARARGLVDTHQVAGAQHRTLRLLQQLREHPRFAELELAERRLHEVPYSLQRQGRVESGQIDLIYRRHGVWTIVEFKTDEIQGRADFERLLRERDYVLQARRYAEAMVQLLGTRPACLLCMMDYGRRTRFYSVPAAGPLEPVDD